MSRLDIDLDAVRTVAQQLERAANRLSQTTQQLAALRFGLDGAIQARRDIGRRLQAAYHQAADVEQRLRQLRTFLLQAAGTYSDAEDGLVRRADALTRSSVTVTKRADGLSNRVDWSALWDSLSPRLLTYMDAAKQERYNIEGIDWSQVPPNLVDSLKASIDASARQQASSSAHTDTLDDVRHVGGYTMEGPERTRYYTDRHGKLLAVDSERMLGLIDGYNRAHGTNLHTPDVALLMSVDVTAFLRYALEQGYDPRTFQPINDGDAREIEGYIAARQQHGEEHLRETRAWQSEALGWIPGISGAKEAADVVAGKDILTGEPLTKLDYGLAAFSAFGPLGKGAKKIIKFSADKLVRKADEAIEGAGKGQWYKADGTINYPPNNGAVLGTEKTISLEKGQTLGRYGNVSSTSDYVTAPGASPSTLSLPPSTNSSIYTEYAVVKPIPKTVQSEVAPWGGDPGGGLQYKLPMPIEQLLKDGYIIKK